MLTHLTIPSTNAVEKNFYLLQNSQFTDIDILEYINLFHKNQIFQKFYLFFLIGFYFLHFNSIEKKYLKILSIKGQKEAFI